MQLAGQGRPLLMPALRDAVLFQVTFKCARKTLWEGKLLRSQEDGMCGTIRLNLKVITRLMGRQGLMTGKACSPQAFLSNNSNAYD